MLEPGVADWPQVRGRQVNPDLQALMNSTAEFDSTDDKEESGLEALQDGTRVNIYQLEFRQHKRDYYCHKLGYQLVTAGCCRSRLSATSGRSSRNCTTTTMAASPGLWTNIRGFTCMDLQFRAVQALPAL